MNKFKHVTHKSNQLTSATTKISSKIQIDDQEQNSSDDDACDGSEEENASTSTEEIRPDQLRAMILATNLHILLVCINLFVFYSRFHIAMPVESVFSIMTHLYDDKRNRISTELVRTELQIPLNTSLHCTQAYGYFLSKSELLKLVHSSQKYSIKNQRIN